jgi:Protein of unknown function (DUF3419)
MRIGNDRVVFGHMHEDHFAELSLVNHLPLKSAVVIASGGDLAFALASARMKVTSVDTNPAQIALVRLKMSCPENSVSLCFSGRVDCILRFGGPLLGWLTDWPALKPGWFRVTLAESFETMLRLLVSAVHGLQAGRKLNADSISLIRRRLDCSMRSPNASRNPLLQVLLGKGFGPHLPEVWSEQGIAGWSEHTDQIQLEEGDLSEVLSNLPVCSIGLISVSNLPDAMDQTSWDILVANAVRVLATGGYLVVRSILMEAVQSKSDGCFADVSISHDDASPICPVVWIGRKI